MHDDRALVIAFNPLAGGHRALAALRRARLRLRDSLRAVVETSLDGTFGHRLRAAVADARSNGGTPTVAAIGGDGTVSMALGALGDPRDATLAVIPCGSGNDFADAIGIRSVDAALDAIERGARREIDFGIVNGARFVNCVGIGLDAEVGALSARLRGRGFPGGASYYVAAVAGLFMVRPVSATIEADGTRARFANAVMLTIGNGPMYGGGFRGAPGASLDDGLFDAYVFSDIEGFARRFALMQRIRAGTHPSQPNVTAIRAGAIAAQFDRDVAMHRDGEISTVRRAEAAIVRRGLDVVVPGL